MGLACDATQIELDGLEKGDIIIGGGGFSRGPGCGSI